jgi:hypothetical protein
MRRGDIAGLVVTGQISVAQIIGQNENDIWTLLGRSFCRYPLRRRRVLRTAEQRRQHYNNEQPL